MSLSGLITDTRTLAEEAEAMVQAYLQTYGVEIAVAEDALDGLRAFTDEAALLAAEFYNDLNPSARYSAKVDDDMADEKIVNVAKWVFDGPQSPESRIVAAANRLVFDAPRRTILMNARSEGVAVARHEEQGCCSKCIARATTMPREHRHRSEDIDQFFHPKCEGMFVPVRKGVWQPPQYQREWHDRVESARLAGLSNPDDIANWLDGH